MSQYYELRGETLWNPSQGASRLFLRHVALFEAELELPSGIGPMEWDESELDPEAFEAFVDALLTWHRRTSHSVMRALADGFVVTVVALARRAGTPVDWERIGGPRAGPYSDVQVSRNGAVAPPDGTAWAEELRARAREMERRMPR